MSELTNPGSSFLLHSQTDRTLLALPYEPLGALFCDVPGYVGDGDQGMAGPALNLLKRAFGEDSEMVQTARAGTNLQAILSAWFLLSMDQFGADGQSLLVRLLNEVLLGVQDGFGGIYEDYQSILFNLNQLRERDDRLERLLRATPDEQVGRSMQRVIAKLVDVSDCLVSILKGQE